MIDIPEKYRLKAIASERIANDATDSAIGTAWEEIAIEWHALANRAGQESRTYRWAEVK
jgi:hypothetical protein